jgi:hypothetical protein
MRRRLKHRVHPHLEKRFPRTKDNSKDDKKKTQTPSWSTSLARMSMSSKWAWNNLRRDYDLLVLDLIQSLACTMIEIKGVKFKRKRSKESLQSSRIKEAMHMVGSQEIYSEKSIPKGSRTQFQILGAYREHERCLSHPK